MEPHVFLAMLAAALCHAAWNAGLKLRVPPALAVTLLAMAAGLAALPLLPIVGLPGLDAWPYLAGSLAFHLVYFNALGESYRHGDVGQIYPIARGTAPLITAIGSVSLLGEPLALLGWVGILVLISGVLLLSLRGGRALERIDMRSLAFALLTALTIAGYTLVDGRGARASGNPHGYAVLLFVLAGIMMGVSGAVRHGAALRHAWRGNVMLSLGGGALSLAAYWTAIWAMSQAPIALVAAVRETSVLFAAALGVLLLREPLLPARLLAAGLVLAGLVLIRLQ